MPPIIIPTSLQNAARAGRVARVVELQKIRLVKGNFRLWNEKLREHEGRREHARTPIEFKVSHAEKSEVKREEIRTFITFRLTGSVAERAGRAKVVESTCIFAADYRAPRGSKFSPLDVRAFTSTNALMNMWPYWREYIQSMAARANLPFVTVPLLQIRPASPRPTPKRIKSRNTRVLRRKKR